MLVLTRKSGESVKIGDEIRIIVMEVKGRQVRLGVEAPTSISIHREEIYNRIQKENLMAASMRSGDLAPLSRLLDKAKPGAIQPGARRKEKEP